MSQAIKKDVEWDRVDKNIIKKMVEEGENFLKGTLDVSQSLDTKSTTLMSILLTSSVPVIGFALNFLEKLQISYFVVCVVYLFWIYKINKRLLLNFSPQPYKLFGNQPKNWLKEDIIYGSFKASFAKSAGVINNSIDRNCEVNKNKSKNLKEAIALLLWIPIWIPIIFIVMRMLFFLNHTYWHLLSLLLSWLNITLPVSFSIS